MDDTILWLHGFPLSSDVFEPQRAIGGVTHVAPDLPGFGGTRPRGEMTMDGYARFALEQLDARGVAQAYVAGLSMGGYVAFSLVRLAPERVRGLILLDTRETADTEEGRRGRFEMIENVRARGMQPVADAMLPKMLTADAPRSMQNAVRDIMMSSSPEGAIAALQAMAARPDSSSLLPALTIPVLVVVGDEDPITPPADAERMARATRNGTLVRVAGAAHLANYEQAAEVNRAISGFLAACSGSAP